jgi:hypothetical protein
MAATILSGWAPVYVNSYWQEERWPQGDGLHREGEPAVLRTYSCGYYKEYWWRGQLHRIGGPAKEYRFAYGGHVYTRKEWWMYGVLHAEPALMARAPNYICYEWRKNGALHSKIGPAYALESGRLVITEHYRRGQLHGIRTVVTAGGSKEEWWLDGRLSRPDGPAKTSVKSRYKTTKWYEDGLLHRVGGPAVEAPGRLCWFTHGRASYVEWTKGERHCRMTADTTVYFTSGDQRWIVANFTEIRWHKDGAGGFAPPGRWPIKVFGGMITT